MELFFYTNEFIKSSYTSSKDYGFYQGLAAFNLESAVVSVQSISAGNTIPDEAEGVLLKIRQNGNYDTLSVVTNGSGDFSFNAVFVGNYLVSIDSDPEKYVATYYGNSILWEQADVLTLNGDSVIQIDIEAKPAERNETTGQGSVSGTITEDFEDLDEDGRIDARRRAAKRKCGLRRKRTGGRTDEDDGFDLIAYGETNSNGEFEYGFLPEGTYRFFVEYPGIPLDESSFVEFEIGEAGVSDDTFVLAAIVTETGIVIDLILGVTSEFFTDFVVYPNPTINVLNIEYSEIKSESIELELVDINGRVLLNKKSLINEGKNFQIDLSSYSSGQYLLRFMDPESKTKNVLTFRVHKK